VRARGLVLGLLGLAGLAAAVAWGLGREEGGDADLVPDGRRAPEASADRPVLVAAPRTEPPPRAAPAKRPETASAEHAKPDPDPATPEHLVFRLVDGRGQPLAYVRVRFTTAEAVYEPSTNAEGRVEVDLDFGRLSRVEVSGSAGSTLAVVEGREELDRLRAGTLPVEGLAYLVVRTVDSRGDPRATQRILYRRESTDEKPVLGFWGETTDREGLSRLGPFRSGTRLQIRPGPRGERDLFTKTDWRTVVVDGSQVDLVVGDRPRLRLRVHREVSEEAIPVSVLDPADGRPAFPSATLTPSQVWVAPALSLEVVEVFVGPTADGRFARRELAPEVEPIDVHLGPGLSVSGRASAQGLKTPLQGTVVAGGRGFLVRVLVDSDGGFRLPGVPDEPMRFTAELVAEDGTAYFGEVQRRDEREVTIPVRPSLRLAGRVMFPDEATGAARPPKFGAQIQPASDTLTAPVPTTVGSEGQFSLVLPAGRWRLDATGWTKAQKFSGTLDLGNVDASRDDLVIVLQSVR
jgi:hypothetical protein